MTPRTKKTAAALSGALVLASGAYALGSQAGDGSALAGDATGSSARQTYGPGPGRFGGPGRDLSGIADRLGVTEAKLRAALDDLRDDRGVKHDEHRAALAKALADELGLGADKVEAALEKLKGERRAGRRDRRGDRLERFDETLATKLGVDAAKVRSAFDDLRARGSRPDLGDLAAKIGVTEAKLRSALADLRPGRRRGGPGLRRGLADLAPLAKELGVTEARLGAAFEKVRDTLEDQHEAERDAAISELADKLGVSEAKVEDVIGPWPHHGRRGP